MTRARRPPSPPLRGTKRRRLGHTGHHYISTMDFDDSPCPPHLILSRAPHTGVLLLIRLMCAPNTASELRQARQIPLVDPTINIDTQTAQPLPQPTSTENPLQATEVAVTRPTPEGLAPPLPTTFTTPFQGSLRGCTWNSQALFARNPLKHKAKTTQVLQLMQSHDLLALQETHSTVGYARVWEEGKDTVGFWSHHQPSGVAGIALLVRPAFLAQFYPCHDRSWVEICQGRAAVLRLDGPTGSLDIFTVYLHSGQRQNARMEIVRDIAAAMRPASQALSIMMGDWNFVTDPTDRYQANTATWTGAYDITEATNFVNLFSKQHQFVELTQPDFTHESGRNEARGASRLDRIYANHHLMDQLDHEWGCSPLQWVKRLSHHRPVSFFRRTRAHDQDNDKPIDPSAFRHPEWKSLTLMEYAASISTETERPGPLRKLVLLKQAMTRVADRLKHENTTRRANNNHERLSATMAYIRVAERGHVQAMKGIAKQYPHLSKVLNPDLRSSWTHHSFIQLRDHAVDLGNKALLDDLRELKANSKDMEPAQTRAVKERLHARLRRLAPGGTSCLKAVQIEGGEITTDPAQIARALTEHWRSVFTKKELRQDLMERWLRDALPQSTCLQDRDPSTWKLTREDVASAIRNSGNTMAGPDRLPYEAWRQLGDTAIDTLFAAGQAMELPDFPQAIRKAYDLAPHEAHPFNLGTLVCLPKKAVAHHQELGEVYQPEGTRPLSIVDTSNRILANAFRHRWEPILARWICPEQRGFLPGRSILANVVDIEEAALHAAMEQEEPATFLFDFSAAFPSISQDYLLVALRHIGLPPEALSAVRALYDNNRCRLAFAGALWGSFDLTSGIRQGCPLSPLLFATVLDPFLRTLQRKLPGQVIRAYADDTAAVVHDVTTATPILVKEFAKLAIVTNLVINIPKTVCIPLWQTTGDQVTNKLTAIAPAWAHVTVSTSARYLGFFVGPGKEQQSWAAAGKKMLDRAQQWPWKTLGLYYATSAYNLYVSSLPSYIAQLEPYPDDFGAIERTVLAKAAPGPWAWAMPTDLYRLKDCYGQTANYRNLQHTALAAKLRVHLYENAAHGGLRVEERARLLQDKIYGSDQWDRKQIWATWIENNPLLVLHRAYHECHALGLSPARVQAIAAGDNHPRPWDLPTRLRIKRTFQSTLTTQLRKKEPYDAELRMRDKLKRWDLQRWIPALRPRITASRALSRLALLASRVPPRVNAAVLSTMWNRWATARRCQYEAPCCLGCSLTAQDSLEHYTCCPIVRQAAHTKLRLQLRPWPHAMGDFLLVTTPPCTDATVGQERILIRMALLLTATYRVTNATRHKPPRGPHEARDMMHQALWEAAKKHPTSESEYAHVWSAHGAAHHHRQPPLPRAGPGRR